MTSTHQSSSDAAARAGAVARPFQALALSGGGFRGLFTARALQVLEEALGEPVGRRFDLSCGTSIGGIVALAVAFEVPMKRVVEVFSEYGPTIFPAHPERKTRVAVLKDFWVHRRKARYSTDPLRAAIGELIEKDATLNDAMHAVAIPAVNVTQGQPQVFKTRHRVEWRRDFRLLAVDVALATAAAPTFFQLAEVSGSRYADGGLFANAPDLIAIHEAEHFLGASVADISLLSIGTTTSRYSISAASGRDLGLLDWMERERLFSVMISSQQQFVEQLMRHRLGSRYLRVDHETSPEQTHDLGLDVSSEAASTTLKALGEKAMSDALDTAITTFGKHQPGTTLFREG